MVTTRNVTIGVKQFRVPSLARSESLLSYCLWDRSSAEAVFIDAHYSAAQEYSDFIAAQRLNPVAAIDTQLHYSHPTAAHLLGKQFGISSHREGNLKLGSSVFEIIENTGGSSRSDLRSRMRRRFSGETLWAGVAAGFGMPGSDVEALWKSLQRLKSIFVPRKSFFPATTSKSLGFRPGAGSSKRIRTCCARSRGSRPAQG